MKVSCTKLASVLVKLAPKLHMTPKLLRSVCEAYDRDVRCHVRCYSHEERRALEAKLIEEDITVYTKYSPHGNVVEIGVTYFKAWHWDK